MKSSHLLKMLVVAFALQGSQLLSLPVIGAKSYMSIKGQLNTVTDKAQRTAIIAELFQAIEEDTIANNAASLKYVNENFNLDQLKTELPVRSVKQTATDKAAKALYQLKTNRKLQAGLATAALAAGAYAAYRNREAIKNGASKAGNYVKETGLYKSAASKLSGLRDATSSKLSAAGNVASSKLSAAGESVSNFGSSAKDYVMSSKPVGFVKSAFNAVNDRLTKKSTVEKAKEVLSNLGSSMVAAAALATEAQDSIEIESTTQVVPTVNDFQ